MIFIPHETGPQDHRGKISKIDFVYTETELRPDLLDKIRAELLDLELVLGWFLSPDTASGWVIFGPFTLRQSIVLCLRTGLVSGRISSFRQQMCGNWGG